MMNSAVKHLHHLGSPSPQTSNLDLSNIPGPFHPKAKFQNECESATVSVKSEKENDDGFFSGFDVEESLTEDMDIL